MANWTMVKRIIRYVKHTVDFGLYYKSNVNFILSVYSDSEYVGDLITRRSASRHLYILRHLRIVWQTQRQQTLTQNRSNTYQQMIDKRVNDV